MTDERRLVTVLFADLVGFTGRAESSDPEQVRELQRAYFGTVAAEVERFGGTVEKYIGDAAMALFGVPRAHDDDAERALRAALAIREGVESLAGDLEVRIGVNTGEVVGGPGGPQQGEYSVSGDAVNVAARLQQSAQPNEILVGGMTRRLAYEAFGFAAGETMAVKGRDQPIEAWRLEGAHSEQPRGRGSEARLVGRERELSALASALEEAREGRGLMIALVGEPGIGKSRLALEVMREAEGSGFLTAWTSSRSYASVFPYHLVGQLLPQLLGREASSYGTEAALRAKSMTADEPTLGTWARVIDDVLGTAATAEVDDLSPAGKQRILVQAVGSLLRSMSAQTPIVLVLDDLHWADPASLAVVEELLPVLPELRLALIVTYRSNWSHGWEGRGAYEQINLRPLRPADARRLASELATGATIPDDVADRVLERSGGNPLFLEELVHSERSAPAEHGQRLPASIHEMLLARLDSLAPEARRLLQLASVVGMEFGERMIADLAETDAAAAEDALRILQRAELIQGNIATANERGFVFRHPLIHEVAYGSLVTSTRRAVHGRVARWLEEHGGEERVAELARHYEHSDDRERARRYLRLAGERAHALNATREAFDWFMAAASAHQDDPPRQAAMLEAAAGESHLLGEVDEADRIQREAVSLYESIGNDRDAARARIWLGRYVWLLGDPEESQRQNALAVEGLERHGPSADLAMAYSFRAQTLMLVPDFDAGEHWARKAIEVAEVTGATQALIHAYNNLGTCLIGKGDAAGVAHLRRSRDLAMEAHLPDEVGRANTNLSGQGYRIHPLGYAEMDAHLLEGTEFSWRTIPDGIFDRWIRAARAEFMVASARWDEAERLVFALNADAAEAYLGIEIRSLRGLLFAYRGRYDEAHAMTSGMLDTALRIGDLQAVIPSLVTDAAIRIGLEDDAGGLAALAQAVEHRGELAETPLSAWLAFEAVDLLTMLVVRNRDEAAVHEAADQLAGYARRIAPDVLAERDLVGAEVARALFGATVEQLASLGRRTGVSLALPEGAPGRGPALSVLDREHRLFDSARIRLWLAEDGDPSGLASAAATFEELGAHPYLARAASASPG